VPIIDGLRDLRESITHPPSSTGCGICARASPIRVSATSLPKWLPRSRVGAHCPNRCVSSRKSSAPFTPA
jgi:hypothetical protein